MSVEINNQITGLTLISGYNELNTGNNTIIVELPANYTLITEPYLNIQYIGYYSNINATRENNRFTISVNISNISAVVRATLHGVASETSQLITDYPTIRVYKVDKTIMLAVMNERFYQVASDSYIDLSQFIINYLRYPFSISESQTSETIRLGWKSTNESAKLALEQIKEVTIFDAVVNGQTETTNDIANSRIIFELPFVGKYEFDATYINQRLKIIYKIDILCNIATLYFYANGVLVDSLDTTIGYNIPFTIRGYVHKQEVRSFNTDFNNNINANITPKVTVLYKKRINDTLHNNTIICDYVKNFKGEIFCNYLYNMDYLQKQELDILTQLFKNGVYLKDYHNTSVT